MFCYDNECDGNHNNCNHIKNLNKVMLEFNDFTSENNIETGRDVLCLVSSYEEPPYFIVMNKKIYGLVNSFDGDVLENTKIIKWAYLPEV